MVRISWPKCFYEKRVIGDYLQDILDAIVAIEEFVEGITIDKFKQDRKTILLLQEQLWVRAVKIFLNPLEASIQMFHGELCRDKLIHEYFGVDIDVLWETAAGCASS